MSDVNGATVVTLQVSVDDLNFVLQNLDANPLKVSVMVVAGLINKLQSQANAALSEAEPNPPAKPAPKTRKWQ